MSALCTEENADPCSYIFCNLGSYVHSYNCGFSVMTKTNPQGN